MFGYLYRTSFNPLPGNLGVQYVPAAGEAAEHPSHFGFHPHPSVRPQRKADQIVRELHRGVDALTSGPLHLNVIDPPHTTHI